MPVLIRPARTEDAPALSALVQDAYGGYVETIGRRPAPMDADYTAQIREADVFVAQDDGELSGLIVLVVADEHVLVENVAVAPERQSAGIGRALLAHAERFARARGFDELRLYTNEAMTRNIGIYRRLGWVETGRRPSAGFARVYFTKRLRDDPPRASSPGGCPPGPAPASGAGSASEAS